MPRALRPIRAAREHVPHVEPRVADRGAVGGERGVGRAAERRVGINGGVARFSPRHRERGAQGEAIEQLEARRQIRRELGRDDVGRRRTDGADVVGDVARSQGVEGQPERRAARRRSRSAASPAGTSRRRRPGRPAPPDDRGGTSAAEPRRNPPRARRRSPPRREAPAWRGTDAGLVPFVSSLRVPVCACGVRPPRSPGYG